MTAAQAIVSVGDWTRPMVTHSVTTVNPTMTNRPIPVRPQDREIWQAALTRGQERRLGVTYRDTQTYGDVVVMTYAVDSYSERRTRHAVAVSRDSYDVVEGRCDCDAVLLGAKPCQHIAMAVNEAEWWPAGMQIASQTLAPILCGCGSGLPVEDDGQCLVCWACALPTPGPRFGMGALVRCDRMRRTVFVVRGQRYDNGVGWVYKLETITGLSWGWETERELVAHTNRKRARA